MRIFENMIDRKSVTASGKKVSVEIAWESS